MASKKNEAAKPADDGKCPNCGACQHCGHGGTKFVPYPVYPQPYRPNLYTVWCQTTSGGTGPQSSAISGTYFNNQGGVQ